MDLIAIIKIAGRALARNKMRSALTMLGIIIGVGAVIAMVGVGQGASKQVQERIAAMGSNVLVVSAGTVTVNGMHMGYGATKTLIYDDRQAILRECPAVQTAAATSGTQAQVVFGNDNWYTRVTGTEPEYIDVRSWPMAEGDFFTSQDMDLASNVAVIGETVRQNLFGATDPIGQTIRVKNLPFRVVGLLSPKGQSAAGMGQDQDDTILVPLTTLLKKITGQDWLQNVMVSAVSREASYTAEQQITSLLRDRHRIRQGQPDDFFVRNQADMAEMADQTQSVMTYLLASIASVSLLVGGIGIMNIMLVSVTERTREIGIRMAIGATETDVQRQFLIEAVVLSLIGGAIGILFGVGSSYVITTTLKWAVQISPIAIGIAVIFSMAVGVFFGFYPARKAARLDPIEALRYE
ncbi:MAG TPA: ABC transporter permease [Candidatus Angelobacter sp.]|nr:ABC transporter permease [Candidatus Angelobacter sp.]